MKTRACLRHISAALFAFAIAAAASAQDQTPAPPAPQSPAGSTAGSGSGQRGGGRGFGGMVGGSVMGTVTAASADQYTIKTDAGDVYSVHLSDRTRIIKMPPFQRREPGQGNGGQANSAGNGGGPSTTEAQGSGEGQGAGEGRGRSMGGNPPQPLKPADIKVGDVIQVRGEIDEAAKTVPAMMVVQLDPERVAQIRAQNAEFGKNWLMGRVTAVNDTKVTITGSVDNAPHTFVVDEDTIFRQRRDPITLADIKVGDMVRIDGAVKDGVFTAKRVNSMGGPPANTSVPRTPPAAAAPPQ